MSLPVQVPLQSVVAVAGQTVFPFTFRCDDGTTIQVYLNDVLQGGATVAPNADQTAAPGGTVTLVAPAAVNDVVSIERVTPPAQTMALTPFGAFGAVAFIAVLDKIVELVQEVLATLGRMFRVTRANLALFSSLDLPTPQDGMALAYAADPAHAGKFTLSSILAASKQYVEDTIQGVLSGGSLNAPVSWVNLADGILSSFPLAGAPFASADLYVVTIDGVPQEPNTAYSINLTVNPAQLVFTGVPPANGRIFARTLGYAKGVNVADNSLVTATGGVTPRTLAAWMADALNVKSLGVKGDGATDDSAAIQAAIVTAAGKALYFPPGTYLAKNVAIANAIRILGAGRLVTTFKLPALLALDGSPIFNITVAGVSIHHCGLDGNKAAQPADGFSDSFNGGGNGTGRAYRALIRAYNAAAEIVGLIVEDCYLQNAYGAGIAAQNVSHAKVRRNIGNNNNFETVFLSSTTATGGAVYYAGSEVVDNEITNTGSGHATINGNAIILNHATEFIAANNYVQNVERNGLKCESCKNGVVRGNTVDTVTKTDFGGMQLQQMASDIIVDGNKISNAGQGINNGTVAGGTGYFNISLINNVFDTMTGPGSGHGISFNFPVTGSTGIIIANNSFRAISGAAIYLVAGLWADVTLVNNNIQTTGGVGNQYGIRVVTDTAGAAGLTVNGNLVDMNGATSAGAGISLGTVQTIAQAVIVGNTVLNAGRTTITDGNVAIFTSGVFGGNVTNGFIRMGSTGLQSLGPSTGGFTAGFQYAGTQLTAVTFANLPAASNGTMLFCSDATSGSSPATGAGTGAFVIRQNGAWKAL